MGLTHELKTWPPHFDAAFCGAKPFEFRRDDRAGGFNVGDWLLLREFDPTSQAYTGRTLYRYVTYVLRDFCGMLPGYVCLGVLQA